jgi:tRNA-dihydrouridine synthase B
VNSLCLGPHQLEPVVPDQPVLTLAPMAGVGNWVFRLMCARLGARIVGVEFVNCRNIDIDALHVRRALDFSDVAVYDGTGMALLQAQIYGNDPQLIARGAQRFEELGAHIVDINFGCSVPRIVEKGSGAAYLLDLDRLYAAVQQTVDAVSIPVTIKTRLGWDADSINILEVVRRAQDAGAQAIGIHARTVQQKYHGAADWSWIARACEAATVPIIGNGDVRTPQDAARMQHETGCQAVMIGRAALGNPWIFAGRRGASLSERIDLALEQLHNMAVFKGERTGVLETRKHLAMYFRELPRKSALRRQILTTESLGALVELLRDWQHQLHQDGPDPDLSLSAEEALKLAWGGNG